MKAKDDLFWLAQARHYATKSKDPSTKVGCLLVRPDGTLASAGFNGFPRGIHDTDERLNDRDTKLRLTLHAEINALHFAVENVHGFTAYCTFAPCVNCALSLIQRGIIRVVYPVVLNSRWAESQAEAEALFREAGMQVSPIDLDGLLPQAEDNIPIYSESG
jgi:dCMP deaminase